MSVDREDYIVYGFKLPYEIEDKSGNVIDFYDDKFLPLIEGHEGEKYSIIADGMTGEHVVFGRVIAKSDTYNGFDFANIELESLNSDELNDAFLELFEFNPTVPPSLIVFSSFI